jgi:dipeptidyl aminopeptidase/acylaminoacyl peptidase
VAAPGRAGRAELSLVRTESGAIVTLHADGAADLRWPAMTPDGGRVAFARLLTSADPIRRDDGIWVVDVAGGSPTRLVEPAGFTTRPIQWSREGDWLAFAPEAFAHETAPSPIHLVPDVGGAPRDTHLYAFPSDVSWRSPEPRLLVGTSATPFGPNNSEIRTYDVARDAARLVYRSEGFRYIHATQWQPRSARALYIESGFPDGSARVISRDLGSGATTTLLESRFIETVWSAEDGSHAYALVGGDDSLAGIVELGSTRGTHICTRSDDPARCV